MKIFSNKKEIASKISTLISEEESALEMFLIWVVDNDLPVSVEMPESGTLNRVLVIFQGLPVCMNALKAWREWSLALGLTGFKIDFTTDEPERDSVLKLLESNCQEWLKPAPDREQPFIQMGKWIRLPETLDKHDPDLLSMMFGAMADTLSDIDDIRKRFQNAVNIDSNLKDRYVRKIVDCMSGIEDKLNSALVDTIRESCSLAEIPRILIYGESGVGKTLIAKYLGTAQEIQRISIPEFVGKEDIFEYELFGFTRGAYTGGPENGSVGLLNRNLGSVVFLDEIGSACPVIQAKLLAYLDDYKVRPRGWMGNPFYCPTLIVAATNQDLEDENLNFRHDLLKRFTDEITVPPLRDRSESLPFILDCLLQQQAFNPDKKIKEIGESAFRKLSEYVFPGNFRELENLMRNACRMAVSQGREYLCESDFILKSKVNPE